MVPVSAGRGVGHREGELLADSGAADQGGRGAPRSGRNLPSLNLH